MTTSRAKLAAQGTDWDTLSARMQDRRGNDVDWQHGRAAVYVFNAGEDVLQVAREAYGLFQAENGLGPLAFPSIRSMEDDVIGIGLDLLEEALLVEGLVVGCLLGLSRLLSRSI